MSIRLKIVCCYLTTVGCLQMPTNDLCQLGVQILLIAINGARIGLQKA